MTALPGAAAPLPRATGLPSPGTAFTVRLISLSALAVFAALHWAALIEPSAGGELVGMTVVALVCALALPWVGSDGGRVTRIGSVVALVATSLVLILLFAHVPTRTLRPDRWDELASGVGSGLSALPALRVPYKGSDTWIRAVMLSGGGLLVLVGACLALLPRPRTFAAAVCLGVLYAVPIVEHGPHHPYLDGAVLAALLGTFLWGDRLAEQDRTVAIILALIALIAGVVAAPRVDTSKPWIDYEALAEKLQSGKLDTYAWNHSYGPLNWPRDGLEIARVRSKGDLYIKTENLERFDGYRWRQVDDVLSSDEDSEYAASHPNWWQAIHVQIKGLKSAEFLTAGTSKLVFNSTKHVIDSTPGTQRAQDKPLRRGDSYDAQIYYPKPSLNELRQASADYPAFVDRQLNVDLPAQRGTQYGPLQVSFAPWGSEKLTIVRGAHGFMQIDAAQAMAASPYRGTYAIAQQLVAASTDPYDYVRKVVAQVQRGARYTESPPPPGGLAPLEAFLTRDHAGYCQYFAGATALLLRMGGVPARVVAGFSPGITNGSDHVLRDYDAHSWVEVYFPNIGWVTFDPTPPDSPARAQLSDTQAAKLKLPGELRRGGTAGDRLSDPTAGGAATVHGGGGTSPLLWIVPLVLVVALLIAAVVLARRRRARLLASGDVELEELRIALERSGRAPTPDLTLRRLEVLLAGSDGALAYLRALRLARYGPGAPPPSAADRRALRRELAAGLGFRSRVKSLWMLPPQPREVLDALRPRRRRAYTA